MYGTKRSVGALRAGWPRYPSHLGRRHDDGADAGAAHPDEPAAGEKLEGSDAVGDGLAGGRLRPSLALGPLTYHGARNYTAIDFQLPSGLGRA